MGNMKVPCWLQPRKMEMVVYFQLLLQLLRRRHKVTGIHVTQQQGICLISDRHQGIKLAIAMWLKWQPPNVDHVYYIRHIESNFNHKFRNAKLKEELITLGTSSLYLYLNSGQHIIKFFASTFSTGYTTCLHQFERRLENIKKINEETACWTGCILKENGARHMTRVV